MLLNQCYYTNTLLHHDDIVALSLVSGLWSLVSGLWSLVSGLWSLVSGLWFLVSGHWSAPILRARAIRLLHFLMVLISTAHLVGR